MQKHITKPLSNEYPEWFAPEIEPVNYNNLIFGLSDTYKRSISLLSKLNNDQLAFRYAEGKWTIKEIW